MLRAWKKRVRRIAVSALLRTPAPEWLLRWRAARQITVLAYHRVLPPPGRDYPFNDDLISCTPEEFARELKYCSRHLDLLSVEELRAGLEGRAPLPERPAVVTFDDGYADNHEIAFPILRSFGLSACFFLTTRMVGTRNLPWYEQVACCMKRARVPRIASPFGPDDPPYDLSPAAVRASVYRFTERMKRLPWPTALQCLEQLRETTDVDPSEHVERPLFMSWDAAREMERAGMELGGHTRTHPVLSRLPDRADLREEIRGCQEDLVRELGGPRRAFSYPQGTPDAMTAEADEEIRAAGFSICFSYVHAFAPRRSELPGRLCRLHAEYGNSYAAFRAGVARACLMFERTAPTASNPQRT